MYLNPFSATSILDQYAHMGGQSGPQRPPAPHTPTRIPKATTEHDRTQMARASAQARAAQRRLKVNVPNPGTMARGGGR